MNIKDIKYRYEKACSDYIDLFCKKHDVEFHFWVSDDIGGVACIGYDLFFSFTDIVFDINTQKPKNKILEWQDHNDTSEYYISYRAYCDGARHTDKNDFNF